MRSTSARALRAFGTLALFIALTVPPPASAEESQPYHRAYDLSFLIFGGCGWDVASTDPCSLDVKSEWWWSLPLDARLTTLVVAIHSEGAIPWTSFEFRFRDPPLEPLGSGRDFVAMREYDATNAWPEWDEPGQHLTLTFDLRSDTTLPNMALHEGGRACVGLFYRGAEVPEGYDPCDEA